MSIYTNAEYRSRALHYDDKVYRFIDIARISYIAMLEFDELNGEREFPLWHDLSLNSVEFLCKEVNDVIQYGVYFSDSLFHWNIHSIYSQLLNK